MKNQPFSHNHDDDDMDDMPGMNTGILDPFTPTIYLRGEFNEDMVDRFRSAVRDLVHIRKSDIAAIVINSPGGSVISGFQILNLMKSAPLEWITYCEGQACSMAAVILSAGGKGKRFAAPMSDMMIHELSGFAGGNMAEIRIDVHRKEKINTMLLAELAANCGKTVDYIREAIKNTGSTDLNFDPWEAKKFGLVDEVGRVSLIQARAYQLQVETIEAPEALRNAKPRVKAKETPKKAVKAPKPAPEKREEVTPKKASVRKGVRKSPPSKK